jgi:hypothetical protein
MRNTAATDLRAGGMNGSDAMKITGHQAAHVFRHYDLGNVDALRDRPIGSGRKSGTITRFGDSRTQRVDERGRSTPAQSLHSGPLPR